MVDSGLGDPAPYALGMDLVTVLARAERVLSSGWRQIEVMAEGLDPNNRGQADELVAEMRDASIAARSALRTAHQQDPGRGDGPTYPTSELPSAGHPDGGWVSFTAGSGRHYEGPRSAACPGGGHRHRHDVRCIVTAQAGQG